MSTTSQDARMAYAEEALAKLRDACARYKQSLKDGDEAAQTRELMQIDWHFETLVKMSSAARIKYELLLEGKP